MHGNPRRDIDQKLFCEGLFACQRRLPCSHINKHTQYDRPTVAAKKGHRKSTGERDLKRSENGQGELHARHWAGIVQWIGMRPTVATEL